MDPSGIRPALQKILRSAPFHRSRRMQRFLSFAVEQTLAGTGSRLKEYVIGIEVFDQPQSFEPGFNPLVRVEAGRLRSKLREYYGTEGRNDDVVIEVPKGGYQARFTFVAASSGFPLHPGGITWAITTGETQCASIY